MTANAQPNVTAVARPVGIAERGASITSGAELAARVDQIADTAIWCSSTSLAGSLPEGCTAFLSATRVTPDDCHEIERGKFAPSAATLHRLAATAGISWVPNECRRTDNGADPHYCAFQATARVRALTGEFVTVDAAYELDLRAPHLQGYDPMKPAGEMSGRVASMIASALRKNGSKSSRDQLPLAAVLARVESNLQGLRTHVVSRAETGAKARAIRKILGLANTYSAEELRDKVFATVKLVLPLAMVLEGERAVSAAALLYAPRSRPALAPPPPPDPTDFDPHTGEVYDGEITEDDVAFAEASDPDRPDTAPPAAVAPPVDASAAKVPAFVKAVEACQRDAEIARVIKLAEAKGKLGTGPDQVTESWVRSFGNLGLVASKLAKLPDAMPEWMR